MFHFPGFRPVHLCIQCTVTRIKRAGLPHSEIAGSKCICHSPTLIAAYHVLHRLPVPRHPSCALSSLTTKVNFDEVAYSHAAARKATAQPLQTLPFYKEYLPFLTCRLSKSNRSASSLKQRRKIMVGVPGLEPGTSSLSGTRSNQLSYTPFRVGGGAEGTRTPDIQLAKLAL